MRKSKFTEAQIGAILREGVDLAAQSRQDPDNLRVTRDEARRALGYRKQDSTRLKCQVSAPM
jgi:hypothetical protein